MGENYFLLFFFNIVNFHLQGLIDAVLATDMSKHFIHVNKFAAVFGRKEEEGSPEMGGLTVDAGEHNAIMKRMMIKCADVSNPARPLEVCKIWAERIAEEYFAQVSSRTVCIAGCIFFVIIVSRNREQL